jgi:hypothetical protein
VRAILVVTRQSHISITIYFTVPSDFNYLNGKGKNQVYIKTPNPAKYIKKIYKTITVCKYAVLIKGRHFEACLGLSLPYLAIPRKPYVHIFLYIFGACFKAKGRTRVLQLLIPKFRVRQCMDNLSHDNDRAPRRMISSSVTLYVNIHGAVGN